MQKFITFMNGKTSSSINLAEIVGFKIYKDVKKIDGKLNTYLWIDFYTTYDNNDNDPEHQNVFIFTKNCEPTDEMIKGINKKIFHFLQEDRVPNLDLNEVFEEVCKGS